MSSNDYWQPQIIRYSPVPYVPCYKVGSPPRRFSLLDSSSRLSSMTSYVRMVTLRVHLLFSFLFFLSSREPASTLKILTGRHFFSSPFFLPLSFERINTHLVENKREGVRHIPNLPSILFPSQQLHSECFH